MIAHLPVMLREVVEALDIKDGGVYVDATAGLGGHSGEILRHIGADGRLIGIDRDEEALEFAAKRLRDKRVLLKKGRFSGLIDVLAGTGNKEVDGVLFDFGVSMMQFKDMERGFSFNSEAPLDMRMEKKSGVTAADIVNTYAEKDLEKILREYGDERFARKIAKAIVSYRMKKEIATCRELAGVVSMKFKKRGRSHPATRTFQALRIEVNDEIEEIRKGLSASLNILKKGGRLCTIAYHSLEDRTVKQFMKNKSMEGEIRIVTKKPLAPSPEEIRANPSSRSAKLRTAEKI